MNEGEEGKPRKRKKKTRRLAKEEVEDRGKTGRKKRKPADDEADGEKRGQTERRKKKKKKKAEEEAEVETRGKTGRRKRNKTDRVDREEVEKRGKTERRKRNKTDRVKRDDVEKRGKTERRSRGKTTRRVRAGAETGGVKRPAQGSSKTLAALGLLLIVALCVGGMLALSGGDGSAGGSAIAKGSGSGSDWVQIYDESTETDEPEDEDEDDGVDRRPVVPIKDGLVEFEGRRMKAEERDRIVAERMKGRGPIEKVLGRALFDHKTERFRFFAAKTGFADEAKEKRQFEYFCKNVQRYFDGWWERNKERLAEYTNGELDSKDKLPQLMVALISKGAFDRYTTLCKKRCPRAKWETGFHDETTGIVWAFHNVRAPHPPFYDSFLFACYTRKYDEDKQRTPGEYIIWQKGSNAFGVLGIDVQVAVNEHWLVALERGGTYDAVEISREYLDALEAIYQHFAKNYGEVMKSRGQMPLVPIYVFKDRAGYKRHGKKVGDDFLNYTAGHYEPKNKLMMTFRPATAAEDPIGVLLHEGAHVLMHYLCKFREPTPGDLFWLQEGIADFCAGYRKTATGFEVGTPNKGRIKEFRMIRMMASAKFLKMTPLAELLKFDLIKFAMMMRGPGDQRKKSMKMGVLYCQCWALIHFLHHYKDGKYRPKLKLLIERVLNKGSTYADFQAVFGTDLDVAQMEKELLEYMKTLTG